jgi:RNA polymerase sigma factor (sigma-70 family)
METLVRPASGETDDAELVRRARGGENAAYDALFARHYQKVYSLVARLGSEPCDAEDVAQTVFVRAYESLGRLRDGQAFLGWVYRIAVNLVRDRAKSARRRPWVRFSDMLRRGRDAGSPEEPVEFADPAQDPARIVARSELHRVLKAQIACLPLEHREVLLLHHAEGLDLRQVAEIVGVAEGTVKSRLGRARQRLRRSMSPWIETEG